MGVDTVDSFSPHMPRVDTAFVPRSNPEEVTAVEGGNTLRFGTAHLRLVGVELTGDSIQDLKANAFLVGSVLGKKVRTLYSDPWGEGGENPYLLGYVFLGELCVNEELVRQGLAKASPRFAYSHFKKMASLERYARLNKLGIWSK